MARKINTGGGQSTPGGTPAPKRPSGKSLPKRRSQPHDAAVPVRRRPKAPAPSFAPIRPAASLPAGAKAALALARPALEAFPDSPGSFIDRGLPLPDSYDADRLVVMPRDPLWVFCYWELSGWVLPLLRQQRGQRFIDSCAWVLRVYRLNEGTAVDIEINPAAGNWYLNVGVPGRYQVEMALLSPAGEWQTLVVSRVAETAALCPSAVCDEEWRLRPGDEEALVLHLRRLLRGAAAGERSGSGFSGSSGLASGFSGSSPLGARTCETGAWGWSFAGSSGSSAGGDSLLKTSPPALRAGQTGNTQVNLPDCAPTRSHQPHFTVKLPRQITAPPPPPATWPPPNSGNLFSRD